VHHPNTEGIVYLDGKLMFASKATRRLYVLDLYTMTCTRTSSKVGNTTLGGGIMDGEADQLSLHGDKILFVAEEGGSKPGVFVQHGSEFFALLQLFDSKCASLGEDEDVTEVDFSPETK
jgi:hypothetical protein